MSIESRAVMATALLALSGCAPSASTGKTLPPEAHAEIENVIHAIFDAMRSSDSASLRTLFHPDASLATVVDGPDGRRVVRTPISAFIEAVGAPKEELWDERIGEITAQVEGPLATAWMSYTFFLDDRLSHCGVNAMQLFRSADGWRVFHIADTRRRDGCDVRPR